MANKLQTTIKLKMKEGKRYQSKQFTSAEYLPGSVAKEATKVLTKMSNAETTEDVINSLDACVDFIAKVIFEGQFTGKEYEDGMDSREITEITGKLMRSVSQGYDSVYSEQKKK